MEMQNKTMWKLAVKSIFYNKRKSLLIIFTIMLSVCLIFSVMTYRNSYRSLEKREAREKAGEYHAEYMDVGLWQLERIKKSHDLCWYYVHEELDSISKKISYNVKIRLKSNFESRKQIEDLALAMGIREENINYNTVYLDAFDIEITDIFGLAAIIAFILFIAVIVVLNIYNVYFDRNIKIYGILKAVGATNLQLRIFVFYESLILGSLGIIAGIVAGMGMSFCVVPLTNQIDRGVAEIITDISALSFPVAAAAGYFIVLLASGSPLRKLMQISVTGAYHYNSISIKGRNIGRLTDKISIKYLAYIYVVRYRKKLAFNILSVTATFILFIVAGSIIGSMNVDSLTNLTIGGDYSVQISEMVSRGEEHMDLLNADFLNELDDCEEIGDYHTIMYDRILWAEQSAENHIELPEEYRELGIGYGDIASILYGYDSEFLEDVEKYIIAGTFDLGLLETGEYIIAVDDGISSIAPGDVLYFNDSAGNEFAVSVLGIVSNNITYRGYKASGCDLIVHQNLLEHLGMDTRIQRIVISSATQGEQSLKMKLQEMLEGKEDVVLVSYVDLKRELEEKKNVISAISQGFLLVLFLIVIFNLVNTTFTNILSGKKELGILEAIGLTAWQEKRLLQLESFSIVAVSSIIGMVTGYPAGYIAFLLFKKQADYAVYHIPVMESLLLVAVLCFLQWIIVNRCCNLLERQSAVEKIRYKE